jgi:hypothetical protein
MKVLMGNEEIAMIRSYLSPADVMLEWGAGGSTLFYSQFVMAYYSVEHDPGWFRRVTVELQKRSAAGVKLFHVPVRQAKASGLARYRDYISFPRTLGQRFDRILIDGRERVACAEVAYDLIADAGVLFIHDYLLRPRYAPVEGNWLMINSVGHGQTLAVFQKKDL